MSQPKNQSPLDEHRGFVEQLVQLEKTLTAPAIVYYLKERRGVEASTSSVRRALKRWGLNSSVSSKSSKKATKTTTKKVKQLRETEPSFVLDGDEAQIRSEPLTIASTPDDLMRERGLDPQEWDIANLKINEWDSPMGYPLRQLTCYLKRKRPLQFVYPAREPGKYQRPPVKRIAKKGAELVVFTGDQQAPYQDPHLHALFLKWLKENNPDKGVLIGDTVDFPDISRHPSNPEWHVTAQTCIDAGYAILRDYVQSSENTHWSKLCGNHDERIRARLLNYMTNLYGVRRAQVPGAEPEKSAYSISHLLRLDELGIDYIEPKGGYNHAQVKVSEFLAARHGWVARKGSGASALATLEHLGYSVVVGHTHRQSLVHKTTHNINGHSFTLAAVETGCMCRIEGGLGYAVAPDWQNGFATATLWPDGTFKLDLATYVDGNLFWRDQRYT